MGADDFGEVVVDGRIFFGRAKSTALEAAIKGELFDVREGSAPGPFEVRNLVGGVTEQSLYVEAERLNGSRPWGWRVCWD